MNPTPTPNSPATNQPPEKCPKCGAVEIASNVPRTTYACGASDYDQRPGTFKPCGEAPNSPAPVDIARLRELLAKATPGPWDKVLFYYAVAEYTRADGCLIRECLGAEDHNIIAALRNDAPALLDRLEYLESALKVVHKNNNDTTRTIHGEGEDK